MEFSKGGRMLNEKDYLEAVRQFKNPKIKIHERQRYHALLLVNKGYGYQEISEILFVDEQTISRWIKLYEEKGLDGLKNHPQWGGVHGQSWLCEQELTQLKNMLSNEAMPGTRVGSGWSGKAVRRLLNERFNVCYSRSGVRKILHQLGWTYQRGRKLYINRTAADQARYELDTAEVLAEFANTGARVILLAGDESKIYLEGSLTRRWNPRGKQPLVPDGARTKQAENIYGAIHLGTGADVTPFLIDWQDSDATIRWFEMLLAEFPKGQIVLWLDQAPHHTSDEVQEWLEVNPRLRIIDLPKYTPEENPKEHTWKDLKEEVSHHHWHDNIEALQKSIIDYYQQAKQHTVNFLKKFGYYWQAGRIYPLPA
jgi:transposase